MLIHIVQLLSDLSYSLPCNLYIHIPGVRSDFSAAFVLPPKCQCIDAWRSDERRSGRLSNQCDVVKVQELATMTQQNMTNVHHDRAERAAKDRTGVFEALTTGLAHLEAKAFVCKHAKCEKVLKEANGDRDACRNVQVVSTLEKTGLVPVHRSHVPTVRIAIPPLPRGFADRNVVLPYRYNVPSSTPSYLPSRSCFGERVGWACENSHR